MGLFKFLKDAGAKLLGKNEEEEAKKAADASAARNILLASAMKKAAANYNLAVKDFNVVVHAPKVSVYGEADTQAIKEKVILLVGNVDGIEEVDDNMTVAVQEPEATFYMVVKGDTLSKIAKQFYNDANKYPVIFEANKPMLTSPDLIYPGQNLRIPALS